MKPIEWCQYSIFGEHQERNWAEVNSQPTTLDAVNKHGRGFRVNFVWHRDRYAHTVAVVEGDHITPVLASGEGTEFDDWPPSPALQDLSIEHRGDDQSVALLVGMAGTSHWSLSIDANRTEPTLVFDVACRVTDQPRQMGSWYRTMIPANTERLTAKFDDSWQLALLKIDQQPPFELFATDDGVTLALSEMLIEPPTTVRWKYVISLDD